MRKTALPPSPSLPWGDLQHFVAWCDRGSVAAAAQQLGVHVATVLRRLAALEAALGVTLLERRGTGYVRTEAARRLRALLGALPARLDAAPAGIGGPDDEVRGEVRLTTTDTLALGLLAPLLEAFAARHPAVQVRLEVDNQFLNLSRREADVAIRGSNRPPENLVGRHVGDIQTAPYASRTYLARAGRRTPLPQLDWVAPDESLAHLEQARWLARTVPRERIAISLDSLVGMVQAAVHGLGAAMLLCPLAEAEPSLVRLAAPDAAMNTQIWVLTHPDLRQVARVRVFAQFIVEALSRDLRLVH